MTSSGPLGPPPAARERWAYRPRITLAGHAGSVRSPGPPYVDGYGTRRPGLAIDALDALEGITWTRETTWPPAIADQYQFRSQR